MTSSDLAGSCMDDRGLNLREDMLFCLYHSAQTGSRADPVSYKKSTGADSLRIESGHSSELTTDFHRMLRLRKGSRMCLSGAGLESVEKKILSGLGPRANYTDRATAACQRS
jgi:hypothetical protein